MDQRPTNLFLQGFGELLFLRYLPHHALPVAVGLLPQHGPDLLLGVLQGLVRVEDVVDVVLGQAGGDDAAVVVAVRCPEAVEEGEGGDPGHGLPAGPQAGQGLPGQGLDLGVQDEDDGMSPTLGQTGQAATGRLDDPLDFLLLQVREVFPQSRH